MRAKIVLGNFIAVLLLGLASYAVLRTQLSNDYGREVDDGLPTDRLLFERSWRLSALEFIAQTSDRAATGHVSSAFAALDETARRRNAHDAANAIAAWFSDPARSGRGAPDIVAIVDETGRVIARNADPNRMYGQNLADGLPSLRKALQNGDASHDVWKKDDERKLLQVAMAPVRGESGVTIGALLVGYDLSNGMARREARLLRRDVAFINSGAIYSTSLPKEASDRLQSLLFDKEKARTERILTEGGLGAPWTAALGQNTYVGMTAALPLVESAAVGYVVLGNRSARIESASVANIILLFTVIALMVVVVYGTLIGTSIMRPIEELEEGVLSVINGRHDLRFDIDSAELGGLAYRVNQLLNVFTGVSEEVETTSSTPPEDTGSWNISAGRVSEHPTNGNGASVRPAPPPPPPSSGGAAAGVIDDPGVARRLAAEPEAAYYTRIFQEYADGKRAVGDDVSSLTQDQFVVRIKANADALAKRHGCNAVRFQVAREARHVRLVPVLIR